MFTGAAKRVMMADDSGICNDSVAQQPGNPNPAASDEDQRLLRNDDARFVQRRFFSYHET
jgi:hypothetical protein